MKRLKRRNKRIIALPEITLTPLIDTALTLLIIFMVTTPMIQNAIRIDLPKGQAQEGGKVAQELVVTIDQKEAIYCNNKLVTLESLGQEIQHCLQEMNVKEEKRVWVKADGKSSSESLISVIDRIKIIGGVKDVAIATERPVGAQAA